MAATSYEDVRAAISEKGTDARVEVNQRALIDKILARYATAGAVYRELLQNSNDAEATTAEIIISASPRNNVSKERSNVSHSDESNSDKLVVTQVIYRNNGHSFRSQDWDRLRKIAEGNPDETKIGAFGVGAYTMFSICEEPLVISGKKGEEEVMYFYWKGDALWTKTGKAPADIVNISTSIQKDEEKLHHNWTSFILPSRDPYPLPDFIEFGKFLQASLTFTKCLTNIRVYVNQILQINIQKTIVESNTITTPKARSWWKNDGAVISSSSGMFTLGKGDDLTQTSVLMRVSVREKLNSGSEMKSSTVTAKYASAMVKTKIPLDVESRMIRVTKKKPPKEFMVQIFLNSVSSNELSSSNDQRLSTRFRDKIKMQRAESTSSNDQINATQITDSFSPTLGSGKVFIGFKTSQTTGLGIHLSAPLMPTVEREAVDFVDPALRVFNIELLETIGILMRLVLEQEMGRIGMNWDKCGEERREWLKKREEQGMTKSVQQKNVKKINTEYAEHESVDVASNDSDSSSITGNFFNFASFMTRGVKNTLIEAFKTVPELLGEDDETTELLNPLDDRPLSQVECDAIALMKAYCPRPSTPDPLVGQCLAQGFSRCLSLSFPPVLTMSGVVPGNDARLCYHGMEAFGISNVVRRVMLENAREYHNVIASCPTLSIKDLIASLRCQVLGETQVVRLLKWWPKICRVDPSLEKNGLALKEHVRFESISDELISSRNLNSILYFNPNKYIKALPLPETCFSLDLQERIGLRTLEDKVFREWFIPLPMEIWAAFITKHSCLSSSNIHDQRSRIQALVALSKHYESLLTTNKRKCFIDSLPVESLFLPVECPTTSRCDLDIPSLMYLSSSDLSAFEGYDQFKKVSKELSSEGVSDDFLLAIGVRKTISMEFLFSHLYTLRWNHNPKNLINYLSNAELSNDDFLKLRSTKYLPARDDKTALYSPNELYLLSEELSSFPFIKFLQWPTSEEMTFSQRDFLIKLGVKVDPPLSSIMIYLQTESIKSNGLRDDLHFLMVLQYLTQRLGPNGKYEREFAQYHDVKFLPCIQQKFFSGDIVKEIQSPSGCFYNSSALVMGFSVLDPELDTIQIASRTRCQKDPPPHFLLKQLTHIVSISKVRIADLEKKAIDEAIMEKRIETILTLFDKVFLYLSSRVNDFDKNGLLELSRTAFIPCKCRGQLIFFLPSQIFFRKDRSSIGHEDGQGSLVKGLFPEIDYNSFLSLAGVKSEPNLPQLFALMIKKPDEVLDCLGETKYKMLLCRIASDPPFQKVTDEIRCCPFLLGYCVLDEVDNDENDTTKSHNAQYVLARAEDIYIVDNSFLRRQFSMLVSPMEQQLEEFYNLIGSSYVSQVVKKQFEVKGKMLRDTSLAKQFANRIAERRPLLLSPSISSRPIATDASQILSDERLEVLEAENIEAKYSFGRASKSMKVTSCSKLTAHQKTTIFITKHLDWFDVGTAIGSLILQRCQLEDAFFISSILEAPLDTLRSRGFPVDRVLRPVTAPKLQPTLSVESPNQPLSTLNNRDTDRVTDDRCINGGFDSILHQMFPHFPLNELQAMLGKNPTEEKAREVANVLSSMDVRSDVSLPENIENSNRMLHLKDKEKNNRNLNDLPQEQHEQVVSSKGGKTQRKKPTNSLIGRMLGGIRNSNGDITKHPTSEKLTKRVMHQFIPETYGSDNHMMPSSESDALSQKYLEQMLQGSIQSSRSVNSGGVSSPETMLRSLPKGLECGSDGCEVIPQQNIHPFKGPHGTYKSKNGIQVFLADKKSSSFLTQNFDALDQFATVIQNLTLIYNLKVSSVAIYYEPSGSTIAFNSNKALYFNLRFFIALHLNKLDSACYSYWFTVMAHELAHNLVTAHNKEHGKFTESIVALYLPEFIKMLHEGECLN